MSAHKFWDSDLRREPSLLGIAVEYARNYCGDFEVMVGAQSVAQETGTLPLPLARMVLNCMRTDPHVETPRKPRTNAPTRYEADNVIPIDRDDPERYRAMSIHPSERPRKRTEDLLTRREPVRVVGSYPVKIKLPFGIAKQNGRALHRTTPTAEARWHRRSGRDWRGRHSYNDSLEFDYLQVTWSCGRTTKDPIIFGMDAFEFPGLKGPHGQSVLDLPYCRGGCWSKQCMACGEVTRLKEEDPPDTVINKCSHCGTDLK